MVETELIADGAVVPTFAVIRAGARIGWDVVIPMSLSGTESFLRIELKSLRVLSSDVNPKDWQRPPG
jgi:hypothetical protein